MSRTRRKPSEAPSKPFISTVDLAIGLGLILAIFLVYAHVGSFDFNNYDDNLYVTENNHVQAGLTFENIKWAMTAMVASNWMPVTLFSHMLDCQFFHLQAGMHHLVNVMFHMLASLLLFVVLKRTTGVPWPSAFVALVFAVHPLHVESVAWVAERKDVLSAFFFFLSLYVYVRYAKHPTVRAYLLVLVAFCLGLMAKPMLVTFPFVLLLFDVWPLRRAQFPKIVWEKIPLFVLSAIVSVVTFYVQRATEAVQSFPLPLRIENALDAYILYVGQMFWPAGLAVLYPYPQSPSVWPAVAAGAIIVGVSAWVIREWRSRPYLAVGWFWYLGMLVPVIGLLQVGFQSHADRYMYLPMVGLLIMLAWGAADVVASWARARFPLAAAAVVACASCMVLAAAQTEYWQNSGTLFQHAVDVTRDNAVAEYNLGNYLMKTGRGPEAIPHFQAALRSKPDYAQAESNLGMILGGMDGHMQEAISHFEAAVRLRPNLLEAHYNLALALSLVGRKDEAIAHYEMMQRIQPSPEIAKIIEDLRAGRK